MLVMTSQNLRLINATKGNTHDKMNRVYVATSKTGGLSPWLYINHKLHG